MPPHRALVTLTLLGWCASTLLACGDEATVAEPGGELPTLEPLAHVAASRPVATPAAFALVPADDGALLAWAAPSATGGGVRALPLGPLGQAAGPERTIATEGAAAGGAAEPRVGRVVEVDATAVGRRVGVAWVADHGVALEVQASHSFDGGRTFTEPTDLGPTVRVLERQGGRLAMGGSTEGALVLYHRILEGPCVANEGTCARFTRTGIGTDRAEATRGTEPLEVEHPCEPLVSGAVHREGTWYYAICHERPSPRVTTYVIRPAVSYAAAVESDPGCTPLAVAPLDEGIAVLMRCGGEVGALVLDSMGRELGRYSGVERTASCVGGRPVLRVAREAERHELRLGAAIDHLEGLLPEALAPPGARAVWTGEALLVAVPSGRDVSLRRHQCVRGRLDRTDVP